MKNLHCNKSCWMWVIAVGWSMYGMLAVGFGQTVLSGDHVITGDLGVGDSGNAGHITITGSTGSGALTALVVTGDGGVVFGGDFETGTIPAEGAGTRLMWYPKKGAFRVGVALGSEWNDVNTGVASIAMGYFLKASGDGAVAFGAFNQAEGAFSFTMGAANAASGYASAAFGEGTRAQTLDSFVIGRYNVGGGDGDEWDEEDPLFEVGYGTGDNQDPPEVQRRNAFTIYKNGKIRMQRQGDILMGQFGDE